MIKLNGQQIAAPTTIEAGTFRLTKATRTVSGLMVMDLIAIKRKVDLGWDKIPEPDLKVIEDILDAGVFYQLTYPDSQLGERTITVYVGDIAKSAWHRVGGVRYWDSVKIPFIER